MLNIVAAVAAAFRLLDKQIPYGLASKTSEVERGFRRPGTHSYSYIRIICTHTPTDVREWDAQFWGEIGPLLSLLTRLTQFIWPVRKETERERDTCNCA